MAEFVGVDSQHGFEALIGARCSDLTESTARAEFEVRDNLRQPFGLLHGGVFAAAAELLAVQATQAQIADPAKVAVGLSNQTSFLRPALNGTVLAAAVPKHSGRTTWVWEIEFADEAGKLYALTRITIAIRERG